MMCRNTVVAIGIVATASVGIASIITGHDGLELTLGVIAALSGVTQIPGLFTAQPIPAADKTVT